MLVRRPESTLLIGKPGAAQERQRNKGPERMSKFMGPGFNAGLSTVDREAKSREVWLSLGSEQLVAPVQILLAMIIIFAGFDACLQYNDSMHAYIIMI